MRKFITQLLITLGVFSGGFGVASVDNFNLVPLIAFIIAVICLLAAYFIGADYIVEKMHERR
ncbi:MAG: hypothetical protein IJ731_06815 [Eubacterium sp.]|nr:hypothetical protein [Eubacterium sp.]